MENLYYIIITLLLSYSGILTGIIYLQYNKKIKRKQNKKYIKAHNIQTKASDYELQKLKYLIKELKKYYKYKEISNQLEIHPSMLTHLHKGKIVTKKKVQGYIVHLQYLLTTTENKCNTD